MPRACSGVRLISHRHCALNRVNFVEMILPTVESLVRSRSALPLDNPFRLFLRGGQLRANGDIAANRLFMWAAMTSPNAPPAFLANTVAPAVNAGAAIASIGCSTIRSNLRHWLVSKNGRQHPSPAADTRVRSLHLESKPKLWIQALPTPSPSFPLS